MGRIYYFVCEDCGTVYDIDKLHNAAMLTPALLEEHGQSKTWAFNDYENPCLAEDLEEEGYKLIDVAIQWHKFDVTRTQMQTSKRVLKTWDEEDFLKWFRMQKCSGNRKWWELTKLRIKFFLKYGTYIK